MIGKGLDLPVCVGWLDVVSEDNRVKDPCQLESPAEKCHKGCLKTNNHCCPVFEEPDRHLQVCLELKEAQKEL